MKHIIAKTSTALVGVAAAALLAQSAFAAPPSRIIDINELSTGSDLLRVLGSIGDGAFGVPVAGGGDVNGDGNPDYVFGAFQAPVNGMARAGKVFLVLGSGSTSGVIDTATTQGSVLVFDGTATSETTGSQVWIDDLTGDGIAELIIARQNFTPSTGLEGAGALSIVIGGSAINSAAAATTPVDLASPPAGMTVLTVHGSEQAGRLGIWKRTGDVTGDGIPDLLTAADQEDTRGNDAGAAYLIRGGNHLATTATIDLNATAETALAGHVAKILPPVGSTNFHLGATSQLADLDGNGQAEVLLGATLNRAGASIDAAGAPANSGKASGGAQDGKVYIAWDPVFDDQISGNWPTPFLVDLVAGNDFTELQGADANISFGEELLGGRDYDNDGTRDLFVGDIVADFSGTGRTNAGTGFVIFDAPSLRGQQIDLQTPPAGFRTTQIRGAAPRDIASDTAMDGDFDGDGIADLAISSPHASPLGRIEAGTVHVLFGQTGGWPAIIDLADLPEPSAVRIHAVYGANGTQGNNTGDVLMYSSAGADVDNDGRDDIIVNEMLGDGSNIDDVGNLLLLTGAVLGCIETTTTDCPGKPVSVPDPETGPSVGGSSGALNLLTLLLGLVGAARLARR